VRRAIPKWGRWQIYDGGGGTCAQASFDTATNRITLVGTGVPTYNTKGELLTDGYTLNTYSYDAEGRLTKINNSQHVSISYAYNALGQLVEDDRSNWGGPDIEIFYDPFGRRIGDFDYVTRGFGYWKTGYVTYDAPVGHYDGVSSDPSVRTYTTTYRNYLDSMRWETSNGTDAESDALYRPFGDEWYTCTIYGSGITSYANMDPYCVCYGVAVRPDGRPYIPGLGRSMSTRPSDLLDPDLLNKYAYGGNDPINNVDSGGSDGPNKPPLPGQDQAMAQNDVPLDWDPFHNTPECPNCADLWTAADKAGNFLAAGTAAQMWPYAAEYGPVVAKAVATEAVNVARTAGSAAETYFPGGAKAALDFTMGFARPSPNQPSWWGYAGAAVRQVLNWWLGQ
jgi:YD repeat-containing protein